MDDRYMALSQGFCRLVGKQAPYLQNISSNLHFHIQPMCCAVIFFPYWNLQTSCRGDRHSALSLAPWRPTYGKVKKGSAAQTMCFCCLLLSVLLGWCSSCPTDNVFWS